MKVVRKATPQHSKIITRGKQQSDSRKVNCARSKLRGIDKP